MTAMGDIITHHARRDRGASAEKRKAQTRFVNQTIVRAYCHPRARTFSQTIVFFSDALTDIFVLRACLAWRVARRSTAPARKLLAPCTEAFGRRVRDARDAEAEVRPPLIVHWLIIDAIDMVCKREGARAEMRDWMCCGSRADSKLLEYRATSHESTAYALLDLEKLSACE